MVDFLDVCRFAATASGTVDFVVSAAVTGYQTPASAGALDGATYRYRAESADLSQWEIGYGTYTVSTTTLTRTTVVASSTGAKVSFSVAPKVAITALSLDFKAYAKQSGFAIPTPFQLVASVAGSALTIALKDGNGNDASANYPVLVPFRDATLANGDLVWVAVTGALSVTLASGNTMGTANTVPFRYWIVAFNNGGTVELGAINCVVGAATPTQIFPLADNVLQSSSASSSNLAAGVFATTTARTSKAICILGYVEYSSGLTTAGTYASGPTQIQLFGPGCKKPGDVVQIVASSTSTQSSTTSTSFVDTNLSVAITPTSAANLVEVKSSGAGQNTGSGDVALWTLARGSTAIGGTAAVYSGAGSLQGAIGPIAIDAPGSTSAQTYKMRFRVGSATVTAFYPAGGVTCYIFAYEIMG